VIRDAPPLAIKTDGKNQPGNDPRNEQQWKRRKLTTVISFSALIAEVYC
jgi:hypothetical protein